MLSVVPACIILILQLKDNPVWRKDGKKLVCLLPTVKKKKQFRCMNTFKKHWLPQSPRNKNQWVSLNKKWGGKERKKTKTANTLKWSNTSKQIILTSQEAQNLKKWMHKHWHSQKKHIHQHYSHLTAKKNNGTQNQKVKKHFSQKILHFNAHTYCIHQTHRHI